MARLFEIEDVGALPARLALSPGDWLLVYATGARVAGPPSGDPPLVVHGPFVRGVVGAGGQLLAPAGGPGIVFCQALHAGVAEIELMTGDPWRQSDSRVVQLIVE
jgi:hypothetical protein